LSRLGPADRLLIIAPHPDDETLCCGGVIYRTLQARGKVAIVWLTNGDAFELDAGITERTLHPGQAGLRALGLRRMHEARAAATELGVPLEQQFFLGFPDGGLLTLLLDHFYVAFASPHTGLSRVEYPGTLAPEAAYEGRNLQAELTQILDRFGPTVVLAPSPLDEHPDHRAAGDLAIRVLGERDQLSRLRYWIVHGGTYWPAPRGLHPTLSMTAPRGARDMQWESVPLDAAARAVKLAALRAHDTQMFGLERHFLLSFVRGTELFARRPLPEVVPTPKLNPERTPTEAAR
jgi:LmbE family N-acetylglucosaminyl deacetylase